MLRKIAAMGLLAWCSLATGCWFNAPCCSPYDRAGPTFGDDPSIPNDFNYRKGSILGSDYSAGGEYDDGVEYIPDDRAAPSSDEQPPQNYPPQSVPRSAPQYQSRRPYTPPQEPAARYSAPPRRFPGFFRAALPMNRQVSYQGMRSRDGYQDYQDQDLEYSRSEYQEEDSYDSEMNPGDKPQYADEFDQEETEFQDETE